MEVSSFTHTPIQNWTSSRTAGSAIHGQLRINLTARRNTQFNLSKLKYVKTLQVQTRAARYQKRRCIKIACCQHFQAHVLQASSMDEIYDALAERLIPTAAVASSPNTKYIVGLAAPPGAGKSTLSHEVVKRVNKLWHQKGPSFDEQVKPPEVAVVLLMDGFHLYRHQLDAMEDPKEAHARRGAPWTFDPSRLLNCLKTLREYGSVYAPSFDHGVGDPVEHDVFVSLQHKVIIVEGNYLLLEDGIWKDISSMFDEKWFIDIEIDRSMQRVLKRHILTGKSPDVAKWRVEYNDRPNAELILQSKTNADLIIKSIDFCKLNQKSSSLSSSGVSKWHSSILSTDRY